MTLIKQTFRHQGKNLALVIECSRSWMSEGQLERDRYQGRVRVNPGADQGDRRKSNNEGGRKK